MDLILWRHADAEADKDNGHDLHRRLTHKGERQAARMAVWLDRQLPQGTRVMCSPATRAEQTALALGRKYKLRSELAPIGTLEDVLALIKWDPTNGPQLKGPILLIGHQPWIGQLAAFALRFPEGDLSFRKGSVWWLRSRVRDGAPATVLMTVAVPELISTPWDDDLS